MKQACNEKPQDETITHGKLVQTWKEGRIKQLVEIVAGNQAVTGETHPHRADCAMRAFSLTACHERFGFASSHLPLTSPAGDMAYVTIWLGVPGRIRPNED